MTATEYNLLGQEMIYTVYTFPIKPVPYTNIFLNPEKFKTIMPALRELFSIVSTKPSINTFQSNKISKGYLSFGKMSVDGKNDIAWLDKFAGSEGWTHFHTDFWVPQKTNAIKNNVFPDIVVCIYGDGKLRTNPNNENFYSNNFSIIIKDELLQGPALEKVNRAVGKIKEQLYGCYYFHFKAPWSQCDNVMISEGGNTTFTLRYRLADVNGAFLSLACVNYLNNGEWQNVFCDESEIIAKELL